MSDTATVLFWAGIALDVCGLLLVSAGDWVPLGMDVGRATTRWVGSTWRRIRARLRRREVVEHIGGSSGTMRIGGSAAGLVVGPSESLEERVEFLLRRVEDLQKQHDDLASTVAGHPAKWSAELASMRGELEARIERRLTETQERYLLARRLGLVCLLAGTTLVIGSNVLG